MFDDFLDIFDSGNISDTPSDVAGTISGAIGDAGGYASPYDDILNSSILNNVPTDDSSGLDLGALLAQQGLDTPSYDQAILNALPPEVLQQAANNGGVTGIDWIDKILNRVQNQFEKDPLATIGAGIGILGKLNQISGTHKNGGTPPGTMVPGSPQVQQMIQGNNQRMMDMVGGANAPGPSLEQLRIPIANAPTARDPGLFVTKAPVLGPLSQLKR